MNFLKEAKVICPFCEFPCYPWEQPLRHGKAPHTFTVPSQSSEDLEWRCPNCQEWVTREDEVEGLLTPEEMEVAA